MSAPTALSAQLNVAVLVPDDSSPYLEFSRALRASKDLPDAREIVLRTIEIGSDDDLAKQPDVVNADLIIAAGSRATRLALKSRATIPIIATLIPRLTYDELLREHPRKHVTAVFIDQPTDRHMALIELALPETKTIGVLFGTVSSSLSDEITTAAKHFAFRLSATTVNDEKRLAASLDKALEKSDVLFAVPDPNIYNRFTVQNILLTTFRRRVPVVGFSAAYVNAGALLAVYSTPSQIGQQLADILQRYRANRLEGLPKPRYPIYFSVAVNRHVARSLGLKIENEAVLQLKLEQHHRRTGL